MKNFFIKIWIHLKSDSPGWVHFIQGICATWLGALVTLGKQLEQPLSAIALPHFPQFNAYHVTIAASVILPIVSQGQVSNPVQVQQKIAEAEKS